MNGMNDEFTAGVVKLKLQKLLRQRHFSICDIDSIIELTGAQVDHKVYRELSALHCINYSDMPPEVYDNLENKIMQCLTNRAISSGRIFAALAEEGNDKTFTEDTYLDAPPGAQGKRGLRLINRRR